MPGHYGDKKKPKGQLKLNMKKMPPEVQKRLMEAMKKKKGSRPVNAGSRPVNAGSRPYSKKAGSR